MNKRFYNIYPKKKSIAKSAWKKVHNKRISILIQKDNTKRFKR